MDYRNIERDTLENKHYRRVVHTTDQMQLVLMSLEPHEDIPKERHENTTQFIRIEAGTGIAIVGRKRIKLKNGVSLIVPPNSWHYVKQTGADPLKLYSLYSPPEHPLDRKQLRQ